MKELVENRQFIVFIDELHTLVGAGSAEGSLDAANILKPALSRGEIQCIGSTTPGSIDDPLKRTDRWNGVFNQSRFPSIGRRKHCHIKRHQRKV